VAIRITDVGTVLRIEGKILGTARFA